MERNHTKQTNIRFREEKKIQIQKFGEVLISNYTIQFVSAWLCVGPKILGTIEVWNKEAAWSSKLVGF